MGLAWFDGDSVGTGAAELRSGGLPSLPDDAPWPACPSCHAPLLFRAQIPLAVTTVVGPYDERTLLLFECHAAPHGEPCDGALALVATGDRAPREPPSSRTRDVHDGRVPPTPLASHAGLLVAFEDGAPGSPPMTSPSRAAFVPDTSGHRMRGFLGGATAGSRDHSLLCECGEATRTVARLLGAPEGEVDLSPSVAQLCLGCGRVYYRRVGQH